MNTAHECLPNRVRSWLLSHESGPTEVAEGLETVGLEAGESRGDRGVTDQQDEDRVTWKCSSCGLTVIPAVRMKPTPTPRARSQSVYFQRSKALAPFPQSLGWKKKGKSLGVLET